MNLLRVSEKTGVKRGLGAAVLVGCMTFGGCAGTGHLRPVPDWSRQGEPAFDRGKPVPPGQDAFDPESGEDMDLDERDLKIRRHDRSGAGHG